MHSSYKFHEITALTFLPALILCIQAGRIPMVGHGVDGLGGLDIVQEDLAGGQHAAEHEQGGQDQEVGKAVRDLS